MAIMRNGLLGGFSGKIGDKVGYVRNGVQYVKSAPKRKITGPTPAQAVNRHRFVLMVKFMTPIRHFINDHGEQWSKKGSPYNQIFSENVRDAIKGVYPDLSIDFDKILLTKGRLPGVEGPTLITSRTVLLIKWKNNSDQLVARATDKVFVAIYQETKKKWLTHTGPVMRSQGMYSIDVTEFRNSIIHVFMGFKEAYGSWVSNSCYLGTVKIL